MWQIWGVVGDALNPITNAVRRPGDHPLTDFVSVIPAEVLNWNCGPW
jgi:hypothetical protein